MMSEMTHVISLIKWEEEEERVRRGELKRR
jgi:hypothetical protein